MSATQILPVPGPPLNVQRHEICGFEWLLLGLRYRHEVVAQHVIRKKTPLANAGDFTRFLVGDTSDTIDPTRVLVACAEEGFG